MSEALLSIEEVARRLGIRPSTVRVGVQKGVIPAVVLWKGKRRSLIRFNPEEIDKLVRERTIAAKTK
jgi:excisionase family DNA binding protein